MAQELLSSKSETSLAAASSSSASAAAAATAAAVFITSSNDGILVEDLPNVYTDSVIEEEPIKQSSCTERKSGENQVPVFSDDNEKHMEKTLSATQGDQLLLQEAKDGAKFCETLWETLQETNQVFADNHSIELFCIELHRTP